MVLKVRFGSPTVRRSGRGKSVGLVLNIEKLGRVEKHAGIVGRLGAGEGLRNGFAHDSACVPDLLQWLAIFRGRSVLHTVADGIHAGQVGF